MDFAPQAGIDHRTAEVWWHDCKRRHLSATGHFVDKSGREIRHWQSALTSFARRWKSNEPSRPPWPRNARAAQTVDRAKQWILSRHEALDGA